MPRFAQIRHAFYSLIVLGAMFGAYSLCVVPIVEPRGFNEDIASTTETQLADASRSTDRFVRELSPLFPEGSWELNQPKVLHTEQATILLQDFEQLQDGSLHVKPCTLVFFGDEPERDGAGPTIMQAPNGAILAFDEPLDISSGNFGKPIAGRLVGSIRIFRAGGENADDLELVTSNVEISNRRVWTRDQVSFRLGNTYGSGSELQITRSESDKEDETEDSRKLIDDLGAIELQRLDRLSFRVEQNDLFESLARPSTLTEIPSANNAVTNSAPTTPSQVEVRSDGPMHFDLKLMIATIEDNVTISRHENSQKPDTLRASRLSMHFARNKKTKQNANPPGTKKEPSIELARLIADGNPLIIDAKSKNAYVESKHLEYDFATRLIALRGGLIDGEGVIPGQPNQQKSMQVRLRGPTYQITAPSIQFENNADSSQWSMLATGAGQFIGSPDGRDQMQATWSRELQMTPGQGRQILRINGNASVQAPGVGSIGASAIELWLREESKQVATHLDGAPVFEKKPVPERLMTESLDGQKTQITSQQFRGTLEKMEIRFETDPHPVRNNLATRQQTPSQTKARPTQVPLVKAKPTYHIEGGELTAWVDPKTQDVRRMIVRGQSRIIEDSPSERPFELQGTAIDLTLVAGVPVATVSGTPAVIRSLELDVVGNTIEFDGSRNDIRIPGGGTLKVQATSDLWGQQPTAEPSRIGQPKKTTPIDIEWQRGLHFDGEVVNVSGDVRATGEDLQFSANEVAITLDRIIDLSNLNANKVRPELKFLSARGRVDAAISSRNEQGVIESFQRVAARDLDVDFTTGNVEASGPGRLSFTSEEQMLPAIGEQPLATNTPRLAEGSARELSHLSIAFSTKIKGNMQRREAQLFDNIRMWFGPVANWQDVADPQQRGQLREKDVWMSCSELFVLESPTAPPNLKRKPIELLARGDAYVEGQLYAAKGHQIKYAEEKGMLTFEGDSRLPAELWQRKSVGEQATSSGRVRRIRYWPRTEQFELDGLIGIDVSAAPTSDVK